VGGAMMNMQVVKIAETSPKLEMEIRDILADFRLDASWLEWAELYVVFDSDESVLGVLGANELEDTCFMHAVAIRKDLRGKGIGSLLVGHFLAKSAGRHRAVYLAARGAEGFFDRFGFAPIAFEALPRSLAGAAWMRDLREARESLMALAMPTESTIYYDDKR
jgi:amino-acid N-acetyltransferase